VDQMKEKLPDLQKKIQDEQFELTNENKLKKYMYSFPGDYGGLGDILNQNNYENVRFFEAKMTLNDEGKSFPILDYQNGRFNYSLDKPIVWNVSNGTQHNNHVNNLVNNNIQNNNFFLTIIFNIIHIIT